MLPELPASSVADGRLQAADLQAEDIELDAGRAVTFDLFDRARRAPAGSCSVEAQSAPVE